MAPALEPAMSSTTLGMAVAAMSVVAIMSVILVKRRAFLGV
jgi:hypothetical protein